VAALTGSAQATSVGWVEPEAQRVVVADNSARERRQVRFLDRWETVDYIPFVWQQLQGELVYITANGDRVGIEFPLSSGEIPLLFRAGQAGELSLGKSARGPFLFGTTFGQRFTIAGDARQCFSFHSSDAGQSTSEVGQARRLIYGYACSAAEPTRPEIEGFLRAIRFSGPGFLDEEQAPPSGDLDAEDARQFALGRAGEPGSPQGLVDMPLGYSVWRPIGGS
jgi:hypothetical protein